MRDISRIKEMVRRCLAMSSDVSSPNEAAIALRRARRLMDKYQLDEAQFNDEQKIAEDLERTLSNLRGCRLPRWKQGLAIAAAKLNDVLLYRNSCGVHFQGFSADVASAHVMLDYLIGTCDRLRKRYPRQQREFYSTGFVAGIRKQVEQIMQERGQQFFSDGRSLILVKQNAIVNAFSDGAKIANRKAKKMSSLSDLSALERGLADGLSVALSPQVSKSQPRLSES